uniref:Uncharacterized protein LOC111132343 isoform X2 n=1 Tax=Crassostrea virginica TaxID=6565 RepID=A0A8B8E6S6_CRAVI|nr:uncharacterized protein LOC111132343 isoform X2 [Crassostrea virginica]
MDTPEEQVVPPWTLFFEGTLYKKYVEYMKNHDLSKMDRNGVISNKNTPLTDPPMLSNETNWIPASYYKHDNGNPNFNDAFYENEKVPPRYSPPPYAAYGGGQSTTSETNGLTAEQQKRRDRQTVGVVFFGILLIGAAAAATALIIHYVFITDHERITDHKLNLINNTTRADLIEENNDDISLDDLLKIGPNITTMSPMVTGGVQNGSDVKIDVSDPETFSVPASTEMPGLVPNSTSVVGTTVIPPKTVEFPDYTYEIGQAAKMRCQINRIRMWDAISINGTQDVKGQDKPLSFKLLSNNETCLEGNDSRITTEVDIKQTRNPSAKYDDIKMVVHFSEIQCQDMGAYECWVDGPTAYRVMNSLTVKRYPKSKPVMELPFSIVEDEPISIKGRWSSGFPDSYGELDWYIIAPDNDRENPWTDAKKTVNTKNCQNEAASIISLQATLALNRTKIKLQPHFHEQYLAESERHKVEPVIKEILVVPDL